KWLRPKWTVLPPGAGSRVLRPGLILWWVRRGRLSVAGEVVPAQSAAAVSCHLNNAEHCLLPDRVVRLDRAPRRSGVRRCHRAAPQTRGFLWRTFVRRDFDFR